VQGEEEGVEELFRRGLDWLGRVVRYDLAAVFLLEGSRLVLRSARGPLADARVRGHALELARFPSVRETLESRRARAFTEADHAHGEGDPFDAVLGLPPGHSCMVVPLCAGERAYGVLTLDRTQCEQYPEGVVGLAEVFGQLLALALQGAEQRASLRRMHRQDHAHAKLLEEALVGGSSGPFLEASRAPRVRELALRARQVAEADAPVLLLGEAGAGKARVARAIHLWSRRAEQPFVSLRLAALPAAGLEAALFGGGAVGGPPGRLELAHGGTLFLDGVEALGPALQERLAHALGQGDVRVVAASSGRLQEAVGTRFREDLYFRLSAFTLQVPALRERLEDLPALCEALLAEGAARTGRSGLRVTPAGLQRLAAHPWPGNLRELANVLERAALLARGEALGPELLELPGGAPGAAGAAGVAGAGAGGEHAPPEAGTRPGAVTLEEVQRRHIEAVLARCGGRVYGPGGAAQQLGLKPSTLQSRMKKLGVVARPAQQG
jgi:transcriptional regulator with GAF, ATPase, and Fis domain